MSEDTDGGEVLSMGEAKHMIATSDTGPDDSGKTTESPQAQQKRPPHRTMDNARPRTPDKASDGDATKWDVRQRELEFHGLFTPSFLPLLNGGHVVDRSERRVGGGGGNDGGVGEDGKASFTVTAAAMPDDFVALTSKRDSKLSDSHQATSSSTLQQQSSQPSPQPITSSNLASPTSPITKTSPTRPSFPKLPLPSLTNLPDPDLVSSSPPSNIPDTPTTPSALKTPSSIASPLSAGGSSSHHSRRRSQKQVRFLVNDQQVTPKSSYQDTSENSYTAVRHSLDEPIDAARFNSLNQPDPQPLQQPTSTSGPSNISLGLASPPPEASPSKEMDSLSMQTERGMGVFAQMKTNEPLDAGETFVAPASESTPQAPENDSDEDDTMFDFDETIPLPEGSPESLSENFTSPPLPIDPPTDSYGLGTGLVIPTSFSDRSSGSMMSVNRQTPQSGSSMDSTSTRKGKLPVTASNDLGFARQGVIIGQSSSNGIRSPTSPGSGESLLSSSFSLNNARRRNIQKYKLPGRPEKDVSEDEEDGDAEGSSSTERRQPEPQEPQPYGSSLPVQIPSPRQSPSSYNGNEKEMYAQYGSRPTSNNIGRLFSYTGSPPHERVMKELQDRQTLPPGIRRTS